MGAEELGALAMPMITGLRNAVGSEFSSAAVAEVRRLVRERLGAAEEGRAALDQLDGDPAAAGADDQVLAQLTAALAADPGFARQVQEALCLTAVQSAGDINTISIGGAVKKSTITIGPVTLNRTPGNQVALAALVLAVVALLAFGMYGVIHTLGPDDDAKAATPSSGSNGSRTGSGAEPSQGDEGATGGDKTAAIKDVEGFKAIFPEPTSLPDDWSFAPGSDSSSEGLGVDNSPCAEGEEGCRGQIHHGRARFGDSTGEAQAEFRVHAYDSVGTAEAGYRAVAGIALHLDGTTTMPITPVAGQSTGFTAQDDSAGHTVLTEGAVIRVGTIVARVAYGGSSQQPDTQVLNALLTMLTERAEQAQSGRTPTATTQL
ncbi:hypothetical protein ACGFR8_24525 [Streptomyces brevispora]|uniref:hypothetical protein n=1 Tax=Streptomyces brevispora TaxID=887462 RepID=UPI003711D996